MSTSNAVVAPEPEPPLVLPKRYSLQWLDEDGGFQELETDDSDAVAKKQQELFAQDIPSVMEVIYRTPEDLPDDEDEDGDSQPPPPPPDPPPVSGDIPW